ncbi:MAG: 6-phosphogluconolactonase [Nitrospina sp.]|jgi:6-phosphogluconolactonase|nr:6-phosphogluconolactonase [Nitrospina sp.]
MESLRIFSDHEAMAEEMARCFCEQARQAESNQHLYSVALSGGSQDPVLYGQLAKPEWRDRIPWGSVHIFFADERCVPPDDEESNFKIVSHFLLNHISIPEKNIHRMRGEENPKDEAKRYADDIRKHFASKNNPKQGFDWVFLGLGTDGHTASLFPGQDALINPMDFCEVAQHPQTKQYRITMTSLAFQQAATITYHVMGLEKAGVVSDLVSQSKESKKFPASLIPGEWYLDQAAASGLDL